MERRRDARHIPGLSDVSMAIGRAKPKRKSKWFANFFAKSATRDQLCLGCVCVVCVAARGKSFVLFFALFWGRGEAALCHLEHLWVHRHRSIAIKAALSTLTHLAFLKHVGFPVDVGFSMLYGAFQYHLNRYYPAKSTNVRDFLAQLWGAGKK